MTKTIHTAEDFASVEFSRHPYGGRAARLDDGDTMPWFTDNERWLSNIDMAAEGWVPVREAADQPITLDDLHELWENAEDVDECNEGDILIHRNPADPTRLIEFWVSEKPMLIGPHTRIHRRAPKPSPSESAETLAALLGEISDDTLADLADWLSARIARRKEKNDE